MLSPTIEELSLSVEDRKAQVVLSKDSGWLVLKFYRDSERIVIDTKYVKNSQTKVRSVFEFLNTSRIIFTCSQTKVRSLRKNNSLSINTQLKRELNSIKVLLPNGETFQDYIAADSFLNRLGVRN